MVWCAKKITEVMGVNFSQNFQDPLAAKSLIRSKSYGAAKWHGPPWHGPPSPQQVYFGSDCTFHRRSKVDAFTSRTDGREPISFSLAEWICVFFAPQE